MRTTLLLLLLALAAAAPARTVERHRDLSIVIESFEVRDQPLHEVLALIHTKSTEADQEGVGINIVDATREPNRSKRVTMAVRKRSVRSLLQLIADTYGLRIESDGDTITIRDAERAAK